MRDVSGITDEELTAAIKCGEADADARDAADLEPDDPAPFVDLADAEHGAMIPDPVLPRLAWRDSVSVLFGAPKIGKSTLLGQAVGAAVTGRGFLGESAACGQIAIVTEEPIRLAAARLHKYGIPEEHRDKPHVCCAGSRVFPWCGVFYSAGDPTSTGHVCTCLARGTIAGRRALTENALTTEAEREARRVVKKRKPKSN